MHAIGVLFDPHKYKKMGLRGAKLPKTGILEARMESYATNY